MSAIALVTGNKTLTGKKLIEKLIHKGMHVVTPIQDSKKDLNISNTSELTTFTCNPSSWFSTRSMIREIIQRYQVINTAFILHTHAIFEKNFLETGYSEIDSILDYSIRGNVILLRELIPFLTTSSGFLGMVIPHRSNWKTDPLHSLTDGAFVDFSESIIHEHAADFWPCGLYSRSADAEKFSSEIMQVLEEKPPRLRGKWLLYSEGRKPFGGSMIKGSI